MSWNLEEAIAHYRAQGAPADQSALVNLLREVQRENGGAIPRQALAPVARSCAVKESLLLALIRRIPSLRLSGGHCLELCAGPNCAKARTLAAQAERARQAAPEKLTLKTVPCMRQCAKGPNLRWDGKLYNNADEALLRRLLNEP